MSGVGWPRPSGLSHLGGSSRVGVPAPLGRACGGGRVHGVAGRELSFVSRSPFEQGRVGRLFGALPPLELSNGEAAEIAARMVAEGNGVNPAGDNPHIPSGYTYLGQFIDHDITFDPVTSARQHSAPDAVTAFRVPALDLDLLYGGGPEEQPYLYDWAAGREGHFLLGRGQGGDEVDLPRNAPPDLSPDPDADEPARALVPDPRNDENVILSQLHTTMLLLHNRVMDDLAGAANGEPAPPQLERLAARFATAPWQTRFLATREIIRRHYQWVVLFDFLRRVAGHDVLNAVLVRGRSRFGPGGEMLQPELTVYQPQYRAFIPVEFLIAAFQFGHSMVRSSYRLNTLVGRDPRLTPFSRGAATTGFERLGHLGGFRRLPAFWTVEWRFFFEVGEMTNGDELNLSRRIDTRLAFELSQLPDDVAEGVRSLAQRTLTRGSVLGLPSGQDVARALGVEPLDASELELDGSPAPLWYYVLKEAEARAAGERLGPVGGAIVAETLVGMLAADRSSWLRCDPTWRPFLGPDGECSMADLIRYSGHGLRRIGPPGY